jgi:predicted metal-dependent hydrolase
MMTPNQTIPGLDVELDPADLLEEHIASAATQLAEAQRQLITARRRVAQLLEAERNWRSLAQALAAARGDPHP